MAFGSISEATSIAGDDLHGKARNRTTTVTPEEYVDAITFFAKQTTANCLYPGLVLEDLSLSLQQASEHDKHDEHAYETARGTALHIDPLAVLFTIQHDRLHRQSFSSAPECMTVLHKSSEEPQSRGHILFIMGYPSPSWIVHIGSFCRVDPWFFSSHLRFRCRRDYFSTPSLPSSSRNIITLRIVTIGSREKTHGDADQASLDQLRADGARAMHKYEQQLMVNGHFATGDSFVRSFSILDKKHFIIEQEISVCLNRVSKDWIALVCCDVGNDLSRGPAGPWLTEEDRTSNLWTMLYPTIQQRRKIALKLKASHSGGEALHQKLFPQSAALLAQDYGILLDKRLMGVDAFYAMSELFKFCAFSTSQLLNIMEATINSETAHSSMSLEKPTLTNLLYCQRILESHLPRIQKNIQVIRQRESLAWPRAPEENKLLHTKAAEAADELLRDMEHLEERTRDLLERCKTGMGVLMNYVMLAESRQAISQSQKVGKLTMLAFLYIPLSFTCGLFGMNVTEIVSGQLSVWVWVSTTIPVFLLSVWFFFIDFTKVAKWLKWAWKKLELILTW